MGHRHQWQDLAIVFGKGAQPALPPGEIPSAELAPLRILLAEDNAVNQKLMLTLLSRQGHTVALASNGEEALEVLERTAVDLILMDIQMPKMDGLETTAKIRQRERVVGGHTPIVALTAHALDGDSQRCIDAGMDGYVSKPVHIEQLKRVIRCIVNGEEPSDAPSA